MLEHCPGGPIGKLACHPEFARGDADCCHKCELIKLSCFNILRPKRACECDGHTPKTMVVLGRHLRTRLRRQHALSPQAWQQDQPQPALGTRRGQSHAMCLQAWRFRIQLAKGQLHARGHLPQPQQQSVQCDRCSDMGSTNGKCKRDLQTLRFGCPTAQTPQQVLPRAVQQVRQGAWGQRWR